MEKIFKILKLMTNLFQSNAKNTACQKFFKYDSWIENLERFIVFLRDYFRNIIKKKISTIDVIFRTTPSNFCWVAKFQIKLFQRSYPCNICTTIIKSEKLYKNMFKWLIKNFNFIHQTRFSVFRFFFYKSNKINPSWIFSLQLLFWKMHLENQLITLDLQLNLKTTLFLIQKSEFLKN